jgi:uncharacterized protein with von Willebrand factor type A (vWA) domain
MKRGETTIYKGHGTPLPGLAQRVAHFARFLKGHGFRVFQSSVHDALRGLDVTGVLRKEDFRSVLRTNLVTNDLEWAQFPDLFGEFWDQEQMMTEDPDGEPLSFEREEADADSQTLLNPDAAPERTGATGDAGKKEWLEGVAYSPVSGIRRKNLSSFDKRDIRIAQLALKRIVEPFRIHPTRRPRRSKRPGDVDFRRILKESLSTGGLPMELFYKERRKHLKRLVILADVSGSMDRYARFVMPFILGLRGGGSRTEVFVFSTSLTSITFMVRHMSV